MKYYGHGSTGNLGEKLVEKLNQYRNERNFNVQEYLNKKQEVFIQYLQEYKIDSVVIALSGGIDSAVVYSMLQYFKEHDNTDTLKNVYGICLPALNVDKGASNQNTLVNKVEKLMNMYKEDYREYDISPLINELDKQYEEKHPDVWSSDGWAKGQVVSYLRTPVYYYLTSLLSAKGLRAVVVGTTNKDEGAYLGYFGKASDGMVDIQLISDIHKREVYLIGEFLKVPSEIMKATPTGDMYDNRSDEEVFGTSYEFVELYINYLETIKDNPNAETIYKESLGNELNQFELNAKTLEDLHSYNKHKYLGHSPAVHMDVIKGTEQIKNGWKYFNYEYEVKNKFINLQDFSAETLAVLTENKQTKYSIENNTKHKIEKNNFVWELSKLLSKEEVTKIKSDIQTKEWIPVGNNGMLKDYQEGNEIGSYRLSVYSNEFAEILFNRIKEIYPKHRMFDEYANVEYDNHCEWKFIGVNPLFRFIKYKQDGGLVPHYDWSYIQDNTTRSLVTLVIYLDYDGEGGLTRFIQDSQIELKFNDRDLSDWDKKLPVDSELILNKLGGVSGNGLLFDHAILHDSEPLIKGNKIIIRTDLMFEKI